MIIVQNEPPRKTEAQHTNINNQVKVEREVQPVQATANESQPLVQEPSPQPAKPEPKPMSNREIGQQMAADKGWTGDQWRCLETLWTRESNWNHTVANYQGSGAYGIAQALPASKMRSYGEDYLINPRTQIAWGISYIASRYGNPCNAWSFWQSKSPHWY